MRSILVRFCVLVSCFGFVSSLWAQQAPVSLLPDGFDGGGEIENSHSSSQTMSRALDLSTLWGLTAQSLLQVVLPRLPTVPPSPTAYNLQRALLTASTARIRDKPDVLLPIRAERLLSMGEVDTALGLLRPVPAEAMTPELYRLRIDATLLGVDPAPACLDMAEAIRLPDPDLYLGRLRIFCDILGGKVRDAEQNLTWLKEQGLSDPAFFAAAGNLIQISESKESVSLPNPTPLHLSMLRMARMPLPANVLETPLPVMLRAIALSPNASLEIRLRAAERAEACGALPTDFVRQLYLNAAISKQEVTMQAATAARGTSRGHAVLYRLSTTQTQASPKVAVIREAVQQAGDHAARMQVLRLYGPQIAQIKPTPALIEFAPLAIRSLLADGQGGAASVWLSLLRQQAEKDTAIAQQLTQLWPLLRLSGINGAPSWAPGSLAAWYDAQEETEETAALVRQRLFLATTLLSAVGEIIPPEEMVFMLEQKGALSENISLSATTATAIVGLGRAVAENRKGEIVLWSLLTLKEAGPEHALPTPVLQQLIPALRQAGFENEARVLALEIALAAGL